MQMMSKASTASCLYLILIILLSNHLSIYTAFMFPRKACKICVLSFMIKIARADTCSVCNRSMIKATGRIVNGHFIVATDTRHVYYLHLFMPPEVALTPYKFSTLFNLPSWRCRGLIVDS